MFPKGIKAALIDMDGVLYDSMPHHARAWHKMMAEQGITTDPDEFYLYEGMTGPATINLIFKRERGIELSHDEAMKLYSRKAEIFQKSGKKEPMPGADRMLKAFMDAGIPRSARHRVCPELPHREPQQRLSGGIPRRHEGHSSGCETRKT